MFSFRPMRPDDRDEVSAFTARIWDGGDYLAAVFDDWVADREGSFEAVLLDGRIVGCAKLTYLTPHDAWLEGLRKDPACPARGLGEQACRRLLAAVAARPGVRSVRFSTYVSNRASIAFTERLGFTRILTLSWKVREGSRETGSGGAAGGDPDPQGLAPPPDRRSALAFVEESGWFSSGFLPEGWRVYPYTPELFWQRYGPVCRAVMEGGRITGLAAWVPDAHWPGIGLTLVFLDARDPRSANALFDGLAAAAARAGTAPVKVQTVLPPDPRIAGLFSARGFTSEEQEGDFFLYELPLARLAGLAAGRG
jgi:N-acetylglutamate synthase-like GNAT family acetyltransferase